MQNIYIKNIEKMVHRFKKGDILLCDLGFGEGSEQSGARPCVVVQNDIGNKFSPTLIVAAITSNTSKVKLPTHIEINQNCGLDKPSVILCEQVRTIDKSRVKGYIGSVSKEVNDKINNSLVVSFEIRKRGEDEIEKSSMLLEYIEKKIIKKFNENKLNEIVRELVDEYNEEFIKLENLCSSNRLYMRNYYNKSKILISILDEITINSMVKLKVI